MLNICYPLLSSGKILRPTTPEMENYYFRLFVKSSNSVGGFMDVKDGQFYVFHDLGIHTPLTDVYNYYKANNYNTGYKLGMVNSTTLPSTNSIILEQCYSSMVIPELKIDLDWTETNTSGNPFNEGGVYFSHIYSWQFSEQYYGVLTVEDKEQYDYFVSEMDRFPNWRNQLKSQFKMLASYETALNKTIPLICIIYVDFTGDWCSADMVFGFSNRNIPGSIKPITFDYVRFKHEIYTDRNDGRKPSDGTKDVLGRTSVGLWVALYAAICKV